MAEFIFPLRVKQTDENQILINNLGIVVSQESKEPPK
jgi:hypothetical protein